MRNWAYILVFLFISAEAYADCTVNFDGTMSCRAPSFAAPTPRDMSQNFGQAANDANRGVGGADQGIKAETENIEAIDKRNEQLNQEKAKNDAAIASDPENAAQYKARNSEIEKEKAKLAEQRKIASDKLIQQQAQKLASAKSSAGNSAGQQQAKSGMPMMPPGGGGKEGGGEGGGSQTSLEAPKQPTLPPQPSPPVVAEKSKEVLTREEIAALTKPPESQFESSSTSATKAEIARLEQQIAATKIEADKAQVVAAAERAEAARMEKEKTPAPRTTANAIASTNGTNTSPFDLTRSATGSPSMNPEKTNPSNKSTANTNGSGATMTAVKITPSSKEQASSRLLASATGTAVAETSGLTVTSTSPNGAVRNGVVTKPKASGPVYGMRSTSTRSGVYSNMTVPKALATTMNTRVAVVGGSTPQNHQPPQISAPPAAKPAYAYDPNAQMRNSQPVSAHVGR